MSKQHPKVYKKYTSAIQMLTQAGEEEKQKISPALT